MIGVSANERKGDKAAVALFEKALKPRRANKAWSLGYDGQFSRVANNSLMFKITFEYCEQSRKWEVFADGATSALEALQGFNAVLITMADVTPKVDSNRGRANSGRLLRRPSAL